MYNIAGTSWPVSYCAECPQCPPWAPWYVIPANRKWYRDCAVARILLDALEDLDMRYPEAEADLGKVVISD